MFKRMIFCTSFSVPLQLCLTGFGGGGGPAGWWPCPPDGWFPFLHGQLWIPSPSMSQTTSVTPSQV
eukprot:COSAG01_NODE_38533_length_488_cov_1.424165_1_plen_65_part_10